MAFDLYFAGQQAKEVDIHIRELNAYRLFTFADKPKLDDWLVSSYTGKIFMDSGAYSVRNSNVQLDPLELYIEYINTHERVNVYAQLDEIPTPCINSETTKKSSENTWSNYLHMIEEVKPEYKDKLIPVYHFGEPISYLETILNTEIDGHLIPYIALGGGNAGKFKRNIEYYSNVFNVIKKSKNPNVKVHAFGMTVLKLLEMFPFYSADSTTWLKLGVNGSIMTYTFGDVYVSDRKKVNGVYDFTRDEKFRLQQELEEHGFTLEEVQSDYKKRLIYNIDYFYNWAKNYEYKPYKSSKRRKLF